MVALQKSERRLVYILIGVILLLGNVGAWNYVLKNRSNLQLENRNIQEKLKQAKIVLSDKNLWLKRKEWLKANQPFFENDSPGKMLEELQKNLQDLPIDITRQQLIEPSQIQDLTEISAQLTLDGDLENLLKWATSIPDPQAYRFIKRFVLKPNEKSDKMTLDVIVASRGQSSIPVKAKK